MDVLADSRYHVIVCARSTEVDSFVTALSRRIDALTDVSLERDRGSIEVWSTTPDDDGSVVLFLSETALRAAEAAFSIVPVIGTCSDDARPHDAYLVLDGNEGVIDERRGFRSISPGRRPAQSEWRAIRLSSPASASARMP